MKLTSRKIISYSLFGKGEKYWTGLLNAIRDAPRVYPGWQIVVYAERNHFLLPVLREFGTSYEEEDFIPGDRYYGERWGAIWRFYAFELDADFIEVRDCDLELSALDYESVCEWMETDYPAHMMRWFDTEQPMFGGLSGVRGGIVKEVRELADEYVHVNDIGAEYHSDEDFLRDRIVIQLGGRDRVLNQCQPDPKAKGTDNFRPYPKVHEYISEWDMIQPRCFKDTFYRYAVSSKTR